MSEDVLKNLSDLDFWSEVEIYLLKKTSKMLNLSTIKTLGVSNEHVGEEVKARQLAAEVIKDFIKDVRKAGGENKPKKDRSFR